MRMNLEPLIAVIGEQDFDSLFVVEVNRAVKRCDFMLKRKPRAASNLCLKYAA
jgi:hypothetical protein